MAAMKQASCEAAHVHYMSVSAGFVVGIHQGLRVKVQLHPRLMTLQTDWPFLGEEAAHTGPARERGDGGERGRDGEKMRRNLGQKGGKARAKVNLKRMSAGGRSRGAWLPQWTLNISLWFWSICSVAVSPGFCVWLCFWSSELTPDPGFWPYPLPPATPSRLANMCYLVWTHTLTRTYLYSNTKTQSHMYTRTYLMYREFKKKDNAASVQCHTTFAHLIVCPQLIPPRGASVCHCLSP